MDKYWLLAFVWIGICLLIGLYISGKWVNNRLHFKIGLSAILFTYALGLGFLLYAIIRN